MVPFGVYEWLVTVSAGLLALYLSSRRHDRLLREHAELLIRLARPEEIIRSEERLLDELTRRFSEFESRQSEREERRTTQMLANMSSVGRLQGTTETLLGIFHELNTRVERQIKTAQYENPENPRA